jgi:hypothetical protein
MWGVALPAGAQQSGIALGASQAQTVISQTTPVKNAEASAGVVKFVQTMATIRDRVRQTCTPGADAADRLDFSGLGFPPGPLFKSGVPGRCKELARQAAYGA